MKSFPRYLVFQAAGWAGVAPTVSLLHLWLDLPVWIAAAILGAWILKDVVLYPRLRRTFEMPGRSHERGLVGATAVAEQDLGPEGYVRVRGELWRARVARGGAPLRAGQEIRVTRVDGMTLVVEAQGRESSPVP